MISLLEALRQIGIWSLGVFWIPLLVWTLGALPVYLMLRRKIGVAPSILYSVHRALLFALPLTFLLISLGRLAPTAAFDTPLNYGAIIESASVPETIHLGTTRSATRLGPGLLHLLGMLSLGAGIIATTQLIRVARQTRRLASLRGAFRPVVDSEIASYTNLLARELDLPRPVTVFEGPNSITPCTFGCLRPSVVVPRSLLTNVDALRIVLEHELTHVARSDYRAGWLEQIIASVFAIHPLTARLRQRIAELREICCDAAVLNRRRVSPGAYARTILQFGARTTVPVTIPAPMIVHPKSNLKTRIDAMKNHKYESTLLRRWTVAALALVVPAMMAACSARVDDDAARSTGTLSGIDMEQAEVDLVRLQTQMEYLTEELEMLRPKLESALHLGQNLEMMPEFRRFQLLQELYMQRLGAYETMRMEQETDRRLGTERTPDA